MGRVVVFVLFVAAAAGTVACPGEQPSLRVQTAARRHVLLPLTTDVDGLAADGTVIYGGPANEAVDIDRCAQLCAPALRPGDQLAACFADYGYAPELRDRLPAKTSMILDCAIR